MHDGIHPLSDSEKVSTAFRKLLSDERGMMYILSACKLTVNNFLPIYVLASADIKKDERSIKMPPQFMITLHLLADLECVFGKHYLRLLDGDHSLIIEAFNKSLQFAEKLEHFETRFLDAFLGCFEGRCCWKYSCCFWNTES